MNAVSVDIMQLLTDNSLGTVGVDLFAMGWGEGVDAQTLVMDQSGRDSALKEVYENPLFQILVRGDKNGDLNTAYGTIRSIHEFLIAQPTTQINGEDYLGFEPIGSIAPLGRDDNDRPVWSMNYFTFRNPI